MLSRFQLALLVRAVTVQNHIDDNLERVVPTLEEVNLEEAEENHMVVRQVELKVEDVDLGALLIVKGSQ
jgi:hypothetical protein